MILARLFVIIGGLVVLALTAALVGPYFVDWTSYRTDFEREASAILGRKVTVRGAATARLLPFPSVTFSDVAVGSGPDGKPTMTVETFSMDAELAPFMSGSVNIFDMRMVRPRGIVEVAEDGAIDWAVRPSTPIEASRISVEKLTITEGRIDIRHAHSGRTHVVSEINTTVSARALSGPWRFEGSARLDGMLAGLSGSTGRLEETGAMRVKLRVEPERYAMSVEAEGAVEAKDGALTYGGTFRVDEKVAPPAAGQAGEAAARPSAPGNRLKGLFALDSKRLDLSEVRFETGPVADPYTADGTATVDFGREPRFSVTAKGAQIRFDETVAAEGERLTLAQRLTALETALADLPVPTMPGTIDVNLPAVVVGDTTIRDVRLVAEPGEGGWRLKSSGATLPGRTTLEASGFVTTGEDFHFSGSLLLAVGQPSGFAAWVSKDIDEAIRRLPAAGFQAKVDMTQRRQTFEDLELVLGGATFRGRIDARQPVDVRPSIQLKLEGGALDVDGVSAFASLFVSDKGESRFSDLDLDLDVKAGPVSVAGLSAEAVDTAMRLRGRDLEIDRLAVSGLAGASVSATGQISDFPERPTGNIDASVVAVDLSPLVRLAASAFPDNAALAGIVSRADRQPGLLSDSRIDFVASAAENDDGSTGVAVSLQGQAGGTAISATLSGTGRAGALSDSSLTAALSARNPDATMLLAAAGLPTLPLGLTGSGEATLSLQGVPSGGMKTEAELKGEQFLARFAGTSAVVEKGLTIKGRSQIETQDIEPWMMTTGFALPGMGTGQAVSLVADADYGAGLLVLGNIGGTLDENAVAGDVNVEMRDGRPRLTGALSLDAFDLEPLAAMLLGDAGVKGDGEHWAAAPFNAQPALPFTAEFDLSTDALLAGGAADLSEAKMALRFDESGLRVDQLTGKMFDGTLTGAFEVKNNGGTGLVSGQAQISDADLELALPGAGLAGRLNGSATVSSSGKSAEGVVAALSGSGTASVGPLTISGLNGAALPRIVAQADAIGRDIDAAKTAGFAPAIAGEGSFSGAGAEFAFTVAGGVARAQAVTVESPEATLSTELRGDLAAQTVSVKGTVVYKPGDEALAGSEPAIGLSVEGPLGQAVKTIDTEPLAQFLTQRALEKEQARVEAMQSALLEKQRLRREVRYYAALETERERIAEEKRRAEEEARRKAEEEARLKLEAEQAAKAAEEARLAAEAQALAEAKAAEEKAKAEAAAQAAEEAAKAKAAEEAAAAKAAEEAAKAKAAEDAAKAKAADEAARAAEDAAKARAAEEAAKVKAAEEAARAESAPKPAPQPRAKDPPPVRRAAPKPAVKQDPPRETFSFDKLFQSLGGQ